MSANAAYAQTPPDRQIGLWLERPYVGARLKLRDDLNVPSPGDGEVLIKLEVTGVCHSDIRSIYGQTPMTTDIAGHEGVGTVVQLGTGVSQAVLDKRVGIKWIYSTCHSCEICEVDITACPNQKNAGRNVRGTFQQYIVSPAKEMTMIPDQVDSVTAAPMLCAGITMYSAVMKVIKHCKPGHWLVLPGAGGGLGHIGLQIAACLGLRVIAIDSGDSKRALCEKLGATAFLDYRRNNVEDGVLALTNGYGAHALICTAGSEAAYIQAPKLLRRLGLLVCVGLPRIDFHLPISPFEMVVKGLTVKGSSVGDAGDMDGLMKMVIEGNVVPHTEVYDFEEANDIIARLENYEIEGRVVLRIPQ